MSARLPARVQHATNRADDGEPARRLGLELSAALCRQRVVLASTVVLGLPPVPFDPAALLHAVERGVERAFFDGEGVTARLLDPPPDPEPVHGAPGERLEDEGFEGALRELDAFGHGSLTLFRLGYDITPHLVRQGDHRP